MQSHEHGHPAARRRRLATVLGGGALLLALVGGTAAAKEIGSGGGGGGGGTAVCNPVSSLTVKADPRVGELGFANLDASYGVKPCTNGQAVTVHVSVYEYLDNSVVVYDDPAALLNGKFTVNGIRVRVTYVVKVEVFDAATGQLAGSQSAFVAAIPKGV